MAIGVKLRLLSRDVLGCASSIRLRPELWAELDDACSRQKISLAAIMRAVEAEAATRNKVGVFKPLTRLSEA